MTTLSHQPKWIKVSDQQPPEDIEVLTWMKHGCISGYYDPSNGPSAFRGYYFTDIGWYASHWMPMPEDPNKP